MRGTVIGVAGRSLGNSQTWASSQATAKVGQAGEEALARVLNPLTSLDGGVTVLHDLNIPLAGYTANIDHIVVRGCEVHILDAKVWAPGRYWTVRGVTRRGWRRFADPQTGKLIADKQTMAMAHSALTRFLAGTSAVLAEPVVVVIPSSRTSKMDLRLIRVPGARVVHIDRFARKVPRRFKPVRGGVGADPVIVNKLATLVRGTPGGYW